jgi:hypothetical protein
MSDDEEIRAQYDEFVFEVEDAKRYFGEWDAFDPVSRAILRVAQAQSDLAHAYVQDVCYGVRNVVEQALAERLAAVVALQKTIEENPSPP